MSDPKDLQEAPASVTYSVVTPGGFNALFTIREMSGTALLTKMTQVEIEFHNQGFKPQEKKSYAPFPKKDVEYIEGRMCPLCNIGRLIQKTTKDGRKFIACENGKYDFATKTNVGCKFVEF